MSTAAGGHNARPAKASSQGAGTMAMEAGKKWLEERLSLRINLGTFSLQNARRKVLNLLLTGIEGSPEFHSHDKPMAKKPETVFKERVKKDLETLPYCWFVKIQQVALRGIPDYLVCLGGKFIAIELKKDAKEEPNELQKWTLNAIAHAGGISFVVHPGNWYETFDTLKHLAEPDQEISIDTFH